MDSPLNFTPRKLTTIKSKAARPPSLVLSADTPPVRAVHGVYLFPFQKETPRRPQTARAPITNGFSSPVVELKPVPKDKLARRPSTASLLRRRNSVLDPAVAVHDGSFDEDLDMLAGSSQGNTLARLRASADVTLYAVSKLRQVCCVLTVKCEDHRKLVAFSQVRRKFVNMHVPSDSQVSMVNVVAHLPVISGTRT